MTTNTSSFFSRKILALLSAGILPAILVTSANAQVPITGTNPLTENFDSMGTSSTATLPSSWKMTAAGAGTTAGYSTAANTNAVSQAASSGTPSSGGRYNWGNGTNTTDRAPGFMTSGSYNSPNAIVVAYSNNTGSTITSVSISFTYERYRVNTAAASVAFLSSTNGSAWTAQTAGDSGAFPTNTSSYTFTGGTTVAKAVTLNGLNIASGSQVYFKWNFSTTGGNSQGLGLDDVSLTASTAPSIVSFTPSSGVVGNTVTINGFNFGATPAVKFNGIAAASSVNVDGTVITATVPSGAATGKITVEVAGQDTATSATDFTVLDPNAPIISLSTNTISGLSTPTGVASAVTNYSVTGTNLGATPITVTPSSSLLEIGTNGTDFTNVLTLPSVGGILSNNVFVRVVATNVVTNYSESISHVSGSAGNSLAVSGAVTNIPVVLAVSTNALSGFATTVNVASAAQTFTLTGTNLTTNVTVTAPGGFEVASDGVTFGTNASIAPVSGIANAEVSVRLAAGVLSGPRSGNITVTSTGATQRTVAVSGSVEVPNVPGLVYWNFNAATPTSGTGGDYALWTFDPLTRSNGGSAALFDATSASSGYTNPFNVLASGTTNAGAAVAAGGLTAGSPFFEVQIVVPSNTTTSITNISFGSRSTGTGPASYSIRSSADGFAADVITNSLTTNAWTMNVAPVAIALSNGTNAVRIYGYNASGNTAVNWRIDDLTLALGTGTGPNPPSGLSYTPSSVNGVVGTAITSMVPTVTGTVTNYSVSPTLPSGLSINPTTGVIGGTPTIPAAPAAYTVTAINSSGSTSAAVNITVLSVYQAGYTSWLVEFQLDPLVTTGPTAGAPNADPDSDGFSNASEYAFGTNPKVPNGALLSTTSSNSIFRSSWAGPASGVTYGVQISTNLSTMAFSNDPTITIQSLNGIMSFTNQAIGNKFFRVRATSN